MLPGRNFVNDNGSVRCNCYRSKVTKKSSSTSQSLKLPEKYYGSVCMYIYTSSVFVLFHLKIVINKILLLFENVSKNNNFVKLLQIKYRYYYAIRYF
jgi:hypothetical protein